MTDETLDVGDRRHGSPYDRGAADSYYGRDRNPHKGGVLGNPVSVERITNLTAEEVAEYDRGFEDNEAANNKKEWEPGQ